jgi:hypothetical protein
MVVVWSPVNLFYLFAWAIKLPTVIITTKKDILSCLVFFNTYLCISKKHYLFKTKGNLLYSASLDKNSFYHLIKLARKIKSLTLPSKRQSLKAAIVLDRDVTVKASSKNELNLQNLIKTVKFLVSTLFLVERCV